MPSPNSGASSNRLRWIVGLLLAGGLTWVMFFDSHSLLKRYYWQQELESLQQENTQLQSEIQRFRTKLDRPLPDSVVERIAREEYGMKRPGETVYRIKPK